MNESKVGEILLENHKAVALAQYEAKQEQFQAQHGVSQCPEVRGPFFCSAEFKLINKNFKVHITGNINYPNGKVVKIEGDTVLGVSVSTDMDCRVVGVLGPDPDQILGPVAWGVAAVGPAIGGISLSLMKPGCFIGELIGFVFGAGAIAVSGGGEITPG